MFRETIAYNKDLITGQETKMTKHKRTDAPMINVATVELFDMTGEKIYEAKAENVIHNIVSKLAYMDYFYQRIKGVIDTTSYIAPFQKLILTNHSGVEDADSKAVLGGLVGYADKTTAYAGVDILKGTINLTETVLDVNGDGLLHFVFDFPTNAANGTFQTIWWSNVTLNEPSNINYITGISSCFYYNGEVYSSKYNVKYDKYLQNQQAWSSPLTGSAFCHDGEFLWSITESGVLRKYNKDFSKLLETVTLISPPEVGLVFFRSIASDGIGNLYISMAGRTTNMIHLSKYPVGVTTGEIIKLLSENAGYHIEPAIIDGDLYIWGDQKITHYSSTYKRLESYIAYVANNSSNVSQIIYNKDDNLVYVGNYNNGIRCLRLKGRVGAQNLLAAPVTKTSSNTMKITYDFNIQKIL